MKARYKVKMWDKHKWPEHDDYYRGERCFRTAREAGDYGNLKMLEKFCTSYEVWKEELVDSDTVEEI